MNPPATTPAGDARLALTEALDRELQRDLPAPIAAFAEHLVAGRRSAAAVLFYGSTLRTGDLDGLLDYYILVDDLADWHGQRIAALANGWLPPNVSYETFTAADGRELRAKVAVLSLRQFARGMREGALDTTLWARFAQPVGLVWARDLQARALTVDALAAAVTNAARWAALLGPEHASALAYWTGLFQHTYQAELRVESAGGRSRSLVEHERERYERLLPLAWRHAGIDFRVRKDELEPRLSAAQRREGVRAWALRARLGKPLNIARLLKSAFTFRNGADYVAWKVERHSGYKLELTDWQRRHPLIAAPFVLVKLRRRGVLR